MWQFFLSCPFTVNVVLCIARLIAWYILARISSGAPRNSEKGCPSWACVQHVLLFWLIALYTLDLICISSSSLMNKGSYVAFVQSRVKLKVYMRSSIICSTSQICNFRGLLVLIGLSVHQNPIEIYRSTLNLLNNLLNFTDIQFSMATNRLQFIKILYKFTGVRWTRYLLWTSIDVVRLVYINDGNSMN